MTPREQQLIEALCNLVDQAHKARITNAAGGWHGLCDAEVEARAVLRATPPPEERTCDGCRYDTDEQRGDVDPCLSCVRLITPEDTDKWQPKPAAPPGVVLLDGAASGHDSNTSAAPPRVCAETSSRNCQEHSEPAPKRCALCSMPEANGALYPMGAELWCGTCCAAKAREARPDNLSRMIEQIMIDVSRIVTALERAR